VRQSGLRPPGQREGARTRDDEAQALRDEYLRRAEPLYEAYDKALYSVRPRVYR
jgi:hypothetical protein